MRYFVVLMLVLWAGTGWAETTWVYPLGNGQSIDMSEPCHIGDAALTYQDKLINCYGEKGWRENKMSPTTCEQRMQAVMKAMDEHGLMRAYLRGMADGLRATIAQEEVQGSIATFNTDAMETIREWNSIKRDCWP